MKNFHIKSAVLRLIDLVVNAILGDFYKTERFTCSYSKRRIIIVCVSVTDYGILLQAKIDYISPHQIDRFFSVDPIKGENCADIIFFSSRI